MRMAEQHLFCEKAGHSNVSITSLYLYVVVDDKSDIDDLLTACRQRKARMELLTEDFPNNAALGAQMFASVTADAMSFST